MRKKRTAERASIFAYNTALAKFELDKGTIQQFDNVTMFESPIPQSDVEGNKRVRSQTRCAIAMHYGSPPIMTALREDVCDGFVIGGGASRVMREGAVAAEANKPFWLQLVGTAITTTFAAHLGAVLTHARWPMVGGCELGQMSPRSCVV